MPVVVEPSSCLVEQVERVALPRLAEQRPHQQLRGALPPRLGRPQPLQRGGDGGEVVIGAGAEHELGPVLDDAVAVLLEGPGGGGVERPVGEVRERRPPPQGECALHCLPRLGRAPLLGSRCASASQCRSPQVALAGVEVQAVARADSG